MQVLRNNLSASRVELVISVVADDMIKFNKQAAQELSTRHKIEGFRPGKAPYEIVKERLGEMAILEEASRLAINKTIDQVIKEQISEDWIGQPEITITKLAPNNDFEYKALVTLLPSVKLGDYKNLKITSKPIIVEESEIEKVINHLQETRAKETASENPIKNNDKVIVDIEMFLAKVPVDGGQVKDLSVVMGKDYFVPGFDKQLLGLKRGDDKVFTLHYPVDHYQKNLAGKEVEFKVKIKDVFNRELPKLDADFVSAFGLKDETELRNNIKHSLEHEKKHEAEHKLEREILEKIVKNSDISEVPKILIDNEIEVMLQELEYNVKTMGAKFDDYLMSIKKTIADLRQEFLVPAEERVKTSLVLRAIIKAEDIKATDDEINKELDSLKKHYHNDTKAMETLNSIYYKRQLEASLLNKKAIAKLMAWNVS